MSLLPLFVYYAERKISARKTNTSSYILPSVNRFKYQYWLQLAAHLVSNLGIANLHFSAFFKAQVQRFRWHFESNNSMNQSTTATCNSNNYSDLMAHATRASSMSLLHVERRTSMDILPRSIWMQLVWCDHPICSFSDTSIEHIWAWTKWTLRLFHNELQHPAVTRWPHHWSDHLSDEPEKSDTGGR